MDETATEIEVTVLLFAKAHELVGKKECKICVPRKLSSIELFEKIIRIFELDDLRNQLILAVNENFLILNDNIIVLSESDKIAVIPPLSGGVCVQIIYIKTMLHTFLVLLRYFNKILTIEQ